MNGIQWRILPCLLSSQWLRFLQVRSRPSLRFDSHLCQANIRLSCNKGIQSILLRFYLFWRGTATPLRRQTWQRRANGHLWRCRQCNLVADKCTHGYKDNKNNLCSKHCVKHRKSASEISQDVVKKKNTLDAKSSWATIFIVWYFAEICLKRRKCVEKV